MFVKELLWFVFAENIGMKHLNQNFVYFLKAEDTAEAMRISRNLAWDWRQASSEQSPRSLRTWGSNLRRAE